MTQFTDQPATLETVLYGSIAHLEVHARVIGETMNASGGGAGMKFSTALDSEFQYW